MTTQTTTSPNAHKRAVLYARVSTVGQLDNTSLESQLGRCREYAQERGHVIVTEKIEAISGSFVLARSEYNDLLNMAADGQIDVIVVDIPDRLGRGDTIAKCELLAQMNGATIEYASPGRDVSTVEGFIQKSAEQMVSGIERLNITRRMKQGRRDNAKNGKVVASGRSVYGYQFARHFDDLGHKTSVEMVILEPEAQVVRQIFEWCGINGLSSYEIAKRLTDAKVPTAKSNTTDWRRSSVAHMLRNETYVGHWHYAKNDIKKVDAIGGAKKTSRLRDKSEWIPVSVPAIVTPELFKLVQTELSKRQVRGFRPTKNTYLLRGRIHCAKCQSTLQGLEHSAKRKDGKIYLYYRCRKNFPDFYNDRCRAKQLRADKADVLVWETIKERMRDRSTLFEGIEAERAEAERATRMIQATIAGLESEKQKVQAKIERWLDLYGDGQLTKEKYTAKCKEAESEITRRDSQIAEWREKLADYKVLSPEQQAELETYIEETTIGIDNATLEDKQKYLDWLKVECIYDDETGDMTISGLLGTWSLSTTSCYFGQLPTIPFRMTVNLDAFFAKVGATTEIIA